MPVMGPLLQPPPGAGDDDRQHALGGVVIEPAYMELLLRAVYVTLIGSKYAVVTAAGQNATWLIGQCRALVAEHADLTEGEKAAIRYALNECSEAHQQRNRVVHDAWARRPEGTAVTLRSQRRDSDITVTARTIEYLQGLADDLGAAADTLGRAVTVALGDDRLQLENQLRQEQGHDIGADAG